MQRLILKKNFAILFKCDYPPDKVEYLFISDGSEDATASIIKRYSQIKLIELRRHVGKETALCAAIAEARGEVLCFTDGPVSLEADSLIKLIKPFKTACVGAVSSRDTIETSSLSLEWLHVKHEMFLRSIESLTFGLVGLSGSLFAVRRHVANRLTPHTCSDFSSAFISRSLGYCAIQESEAVARYSLVENNRLEYVRKVRTVTHGINTAIKSLPSLFVSRQYTYIWQLFSHKILRWLCPLIAAICIPFVILDLIHCYNYLRHSLVWHFSVIAVVAVSCLCLAWMVRKVAVQLLYCALAVMMAVFNVRLNKLQNRWEPTKRY
jgi:glycosyltransferase involved in cell wall biosynthesis